MSPIDSLTFAGTMLRCDEVGDIDAGEGAPGLFVQDVRLLSRLALRVNELPCTLGALTATPGSRTGVLVPVADRHSTSDVILTRRQSIGTNGLSEEISIRNVSNLKTTTIISIEFQSDFADPFMLRSDRRSFDRSNGAYWMRQDNTARPALLTMGYQREKRGRQFATRVAVTASGTPNIQLLGGPAEVDPGGMLTWTIALAPHEQRSLSVSFRSGPDASVPPLAPTALAGTPARLRPLRAQALADLAALRMPFPTVPDDGAELADLTIIAAGAPWFLTLFGRDSLLTSLLADADLPGLGLDSLRALAATQATAFDPTRIAEPGKIVHEVRRSELAQLGDVPYRQYYGSVDATPLFLTALSTLGSIELQRSCEAEARAAIDWMRGPGGLTSTGFLRYKSDPNGLITQGWKDSPDSVAHRDGRIATGAIALCEVQGYAYRALVDTAGLARTVWGDPGWAAELDSVAADLSARFRERFWIPSDDYPALALDGDDQRVEVIASNAGHLLFSEMLTADEAARIAKRLLRPDIFTGWGLRTLSSREHRYNPLSYHNGSVWPHDTALAAIGMMRYGLREEARLVASGIVDAAIDFDHRLPELFGGVARSDYPSPVAYRAAAVPQAWASAAVLASIRILVSEDRI